MRKLVLALGPGDLSDREARDSAVRALVEHLSTSGVPWTGPAAVVRVDAELPEGGRDTRTVRFGPAGVTLVDADPQVVVRLPLAAAVELASGSADGA
ncbi:MAG: hypothetical protein ACJ72L_19925, partial [Marmoricola sp.]